MLYAFGEPLASDMTYQTRTCYHWALGLLALLASGLGAAAHEVDDVQHPLLYRSSDGGHSWSTLPVAANVLAIDPRAPATLYALGPTGLSRSTDDGATWQIISDFNVFVDYYHSADGDLLVDPSNSRHLWAARPDGVWQSLDGGVSWRQRSKGLRGAAALSLFIDPHQPGKLEVATSEGLFQATLP